MNEGIFEYRANAIDWLNKATEAESSLRASYYAQLADLNIKMAQLEIAICKADKE